MKTHYKPYHHHPPQTFRGTGIEDKETMPKYSGFKPTHALSSETRKRARQHLREKLKSMKPTNGKGIAAGEMRNLLESSYLHGEVEGWEKDPTLCTDTGCSYVSPDGKVVVAHRGTEGSMSDWSNNAAFGIGGEFGYKMTQRYKDANKLQKDTEKKYGRDNVITIGHSQGGLLAELVGGNSKEIITVNKATRPQNMLYGSEKKKNQTDVRTTSDAVSYWSNPFSKKEKSEVTIKSKKTDPVGEHSYDVLNRLGEDTIVGQKNVIFKGKGIFLRIPGMKPF